MIYSVSWRNIWRNRTRSLVIITAVGLGVFAGVFTISFMLGMVNQRIDAVISTEVSNIQIHKPGYLESNEVSDYISGVDGIEQKILSDQNVGAVSSRIIANCMIASAETGSGVQIFGVDPLKEREVSDIHSRIIEGDYFKGESANQIIIGKKLADKLNVGIRSKVVVTLTEMDGTISGGAFRVAGIFRTSNVLFDESRVYVRTGRLKELLQLEDNAAHQIAVLLKNNGTEDVVMKGIKENYPQLSVMSWSELLPDMKMMNESMGFMMYIVVGIILLALGFGIVNTMLMVILERVKEFGMLMAVGMSRARIFRMVVMESVFLSITGGVIGIGVALLATAITAKTGIDLSFWSDGLNSMGFDSVIYPWIGIDSVIIVTILVIITGVVAAIYPAKKAIELNPAESLRIDM